MVRQSIRLMDLAQDVLHDVKNINAVKAIYLFGSFARGTQSSFSDTDLCVFAERLTPEQEAMIVNHGSQKVDISLFEKLPPLIQQRVITEGKPLFIRDDLHLHREIVNANTRYLDLQSFLMHQERRILEI